MPELASTFISAKWIEPLWKKLKSIREKRRQELDEIGNVFGDPELLARLYVEPQCQHHNPADHDESEPISYVRSPIFTTLDNFLTGEFATQGDGRTQLLILSDAGMGKTSVLVMLKLMQLTSFWPKGYDCRLLKLGPTRIGEFCTRRPPAFPTMDTPGMFPRTISPDLRRP